MDELTPAQAKSVVKLVAYGILGFIILILIMIAIDLVPTGRVQVVTRFGKVVRTNGEGLAFHIPFVERTKSIDTTIRRETVEVDAATSNLQQVITKVSVNYRITRENAVKQYQNFTKKDFVQIIVQPKMQDSIKRTTPNFTAESLVLERAKVAEQLRESMRTALGEYGIEVVDVSVENYAFSSAYSQAIATKSVIEQQTEAAKLEVNKEIERAKLDTERITIEQNNKVLAATKDAEIRQIESQQSDVNLKFYELQTRWKAVDKWDGKLPVTQAGANTFFSLPLQ